MPETSAADRMRSTVGPEDGLAHVSGASRIVRYPIRSRESPSVTEHHTSPGLQSDLDLPGLPSPRTAEYERIIRHAKLALSISCARHVIGSWDIYGVRIVTNEDEGYASIHFRIPASLPAATAAQLETFAVQRVTYTDRDREWDAVSGATPDSDHWSAFVDSVNAAVDFARAALKSAVWAHARGEEWTWNHAVPGRVEVKYDIWGDGHPNFVILAQVEGYEEHLKEHRQPDGDVDF